MPVRLGDIELRSVQDVRADDNRTLVELRVPGSSGSVFQDLGRAPATVVLEGLLVGEDAADALERLRAAYQKAEPLAFASDIAIGAEMTEIVIADLLVRQAAGYRDRYRYTIKLREHVEPPESAAANQAVVDAAIAADAASWTDDSLAAAEGLADPAGLADTLAERPELLARISADELGASIGANLDAIDAGKLGDVMDSVANLDPVKAGGMLAKLKGMGKLGAFVEKLVGAGRTILAVARKLGGILLNVGEVMDLIAAVKAVGSAATALWQGARWSDGSIWRPPAGDDFALPKPTPRDVLLRATELVDRVAKLVGQEILKKARDLAREYDLGGVLDAVARAFLTAIAGVQRVVDMLRDLARAVSTLWLVAELGAQFQGVLAATGDLLDERSASEAAATTRTLRWTATLLRAAPGPQDVAALADRFTALSLAFQHFTLGGVPLPASPPGVEA